MKEEVIQDMSPTWRPKKKTVWYEGYEDRKIRIHALILLLSI